MKAVFMTQMGGRLLEIDRRDIEPVSVYYCAVREVTSVEGDRNVPSSLEPKKEKWVAHSMPNSPEGFAVFLLDSLE